MELVPKFVTPPSAAKLAGYPSYARARAAIERGWLGGTWRQNEISNVFCLGLGGFF